MAEIINIQNIDPTTFELQNYSVSDTSLIISNEVNVLFNPTTDYLEYFIYNLNNKIIAGNVNFSNYILVDNKVTIDPENNLKSSGYSVGQYNTVYNFLRKLLFSSPLDRYYIDEISSDRTEVRLNTTVISNENLISSVNNFIQQIQESQADYFDFYLDFGSNQLVIANNILLDNSNPGDPTILIKLYEPLPDNFNLKSECWIVEQLSDPLAYNIDINTTFDPIDDNVYIKGPNTNINLKDQINNSTQYVNYNILTGSANINLSGSRRPLYNLNSILEEKGIEINIDYTNYSDFVFFSSIEQRINNFYNKVKLIESYQNDINIINTQITGSTSSSLAVIGSKTIIENKINDLITNFDGYEYYLYYESSSYAYPKTNSTKPYILASTGSTPTLNWLASSSISASLYDQDNQNILINAIPGYLREDPNNDNLDLFVDMLGQIYDNIWVYIKDVPNKFNADNRINYGISKDIVAQALRDAGINIYQNNFSENNIYTSLLGLTSQGSSLLFPNTTSSLPTPTDFEYINQYVTSSNSGIPLDDINKRLYKRLYHNLPLLLKKKGTVVGLKNLITSYGIPDTILRVNEYGGKDKNNANDWDYWYDEYNYAYKQNGNNFISSFWTLNSNWASPNNVPATLMFRFKTNGLPTSNIPYSQSLWIRNGANTSSFATGLITLSYSGSGYTSASYSGSIIDPYYQYATLSFIPDYYTGNGANSASIYLPFFDGEWWSVMITSGSGGFNLYSKNSIYNGYDGNQIGFQASSSISGYQNGWMNDAANSSCSFGKEFTLNIPGKGSNWANFSGSFQEIRYYNTAINESVFDDYVMNPNSIEGNGINQSPNQLAFRASLGGELYTALDEPTWVWNFYNSRSNAAGAVEETVISCLRSRYDYLTTSERYIGNSIHPKVTGSWNITQSFNTDSLFIINSGSLFTANSQSIFFDQFPAGIKNPISDKIKLQNTLLPYSSNLPNIPDNKVLSTFDSIQQDYPISQSYTRDVNYVEVAFSPQNEINDDITSQIGFFNMGEYIGDPRLVSSSAQSYPDLDTLRNEYFQKYIQNYNYNDFIRLIKYFDNSLFKLIKDFVPARAGLSTGVVIKQHLLERNKYPTPQMATRTPIATQGSGSGNITWNSPFTFQDLLISGAGIQMYTVTGSNAGSFPNLEGRTSGVILPSNYSFAVTQSWGGANISPSGSIPFVRSTQEEFYSGELSGSVILVTDGDLNGSNPFLNPSTVALAYTASYYNTSITPGGNFLDRRTSPNNGEIYLLYDTGSFRGVNPNSPKFSGF